jgi:hypothetical protein
MFIEYHSAIKSKQQKLNTIWMNLKAKKLSWEPMAQTCNPSFSGDRKQENHSSKPAWANGLRDPILKIPGLVVWLKW